VADVHIAHPVDGVDLAQIVEHIAGDTVWREDDQRQVSGALGRAPALHATWIDVQRLGS
jgi:hypothetical protein